VHDVPLKGEAGQDEYEELPPTGGAKSHSPSSPIGLSTYTTGNLLSMISNIRFLKAAGEVS
jgi:hypothetical protein